MTTFIKAGSVKHTVEVIGNYTTPTGIEMVNVKFENGIVSSCKKSTVQVENGKVNMKCEYEGKSRKWDGQSRDVVFTLTGSSEKDVELAFEKLVDFFADSYDFANCGNCEEQLNGKWVMIDSIQVENPTEGKEVMGAFKEFKKLMK